MMDEKKISKEIYDAIKVGNVELAVSLINTDKSSLNELTPFGTWLHIAAAAGNITLMTHSLARGININARSKTFGDNALNYAASYGQFTAVELLLSYGAEMDITAPERNPLFSTIYGGHHKPGIEQSNSIGHRFGADFGKPSRCKTNRSAEAKESNSLIQGKAGKVGI